MQAEPLRRAVDARDRRGERADPRAADQPRSGGLAALYAIGVIGAVAINVTLCSMHPRLRRLQRKVPMMILGVVLLAIWVTLAFTKLHALIFVCIVMVVGLTARQLTKLLAARKGKRPSLLRQAIMEQLAPARRWPSRRFCWGRTARMRWRRRRLRKPKARRDAGGLLHPPGAICRTNTTARRS